MEAEHDDLKSLVQQAHKAAQESPPEPVIYALVSLTGKSGRTHLLAGRERTAEGGTRWQMLGLTETCLIWVEATSPLANWTLNMPESEGETLTAWARPLRSVKALHVTGAKDVSAFGPTDSNHWEWESTWALEVDGVGLIQLPLVGYVRSGERAEQVESFAVAVRELLA